MRTAKSQLLRSRDGLPAIHGAKAEMRLRGVSSEATRAIRVFRADLEDTLISSAMTGPRLITLRNCCVRFTCADPALIKLASRWKVLWMNSPMLPTPTRLNFVSDI